MFDYQVIHTFKCSNRQPDLRFLVRLFSESLDFRLGRFFGLCKYFDIYLTGENEAVLGSNHRNLEIRLYFIRLTQNPGNVFLVLVLYNLNWLGNLQSFYLRPFLLSMIWAVLRIIKIRSSAQVLHRR